MEADEARTLAALKERRKTIVDPVVREYGGRIVKVMGDLPRFPAEHFGRVRLLDTRHKQFDDGLRQLEEEGLMQVFYRPGGRREPIVGVVGALQFDVIVSRLRIE